MFHGRFANAVQQVDETGHDRLHGLRGAAPREFAEIE